MRLVSVVAALALSACAQVNATASPREILSDLPLDSLIKSLGPEYATKGIAKSAGLMHVGADGRFEDSYMLEFAAQPSNAQTLTLFSTKLRDVVSQRVRVVGGSASDTHQSMMYVADSAIGWVHVVPAKSRSAELDRLVVVVTEVHGAGKR